VREREAIRWKVKDQKRFECMVGWDIKSKKEEEVA